MADVSKAQKLASARKKFKELRKQKKENTVQKVEDIVIQKQASREDTPVEDDNNFVPNTEQIQSVPPLPNYFNNVNYGDHSYQPPASFFDDFTYSNNEAFKNLTPSNYFNNELTESTQNYTESVPSPAVEEIKNEPQSENQTTSNDITDFHAFDTLRFDETPAQQHTEYSNVESLKQLSNEMAELIRPDSEFITSTSESELEKRNQELAALLSQEKIKTEQLSAVLQEYQNKVAQLEYQLSDKDVDNKFDQEISKLREDLQAHVQTVGILVAEKTELSVNLSQFQLVAKQKTAECEELQTRLKASRSRVADLEREVNLLKTEKSQYDNLGKEYTSELDKLKEDYRKLREEKDDLVQELLEVREKLKTNSETNLSYQQQVSDLTNQLSMANIKIQQLTTSELNQNDAQLEQLTHEKFALEKKVTELTQSVKTLTRERDESSIQYQQYAQQLNSQMSNLAAKLEQLQKENESLSHQEQNRIKHISELEKQLQNLQNDQVAFATQKSSSDIRAELETSLELIQKLQSENTELLEENEKLLNEKEVFLQDLESRNDSLKQMEESLEELRSNQPDNTKLLAVIESDKVAASRAISQNTELKQQMESMQEVFMKLNNDKVELTERLTTEQYNNKELLEKLQKTELHLQTLADAIEIKDKELSHLRESSTELDKQVLQTEQLTDRLRHYEAQDNSSVSLQNELREAKIAIIKLTEEIDRLKQINITENEKTNSNELRQELVNLELKNRELKLKLTNANVDKNHNDNVLDKDSAMKHLEQKFLRTMEDIANLTEEKQRLEHLVLQLQGETETIGEYVALYQHQRSVLKQRALEKDQQLTQLANDREQLKTKLEKLNQLIKKLVLEKGTVPQELLHQHDDLCEEHTKINNEINKITQNNFTIDPHNGDNVHTTETAQEIIELLSEIKTSNLIQPSSENFHHCPWCSGQLITV